MGETLAALHRLQDVETRLAAIRKTMEGKRNVVEAKKRNLRRAEDKITEFHKSTRALQARIDGISLEVASKEEAIARHREALNRAKTNKEYAAILAAMNTEKADNSRQENDALKLMDEMATLKAGGDQLESQRQKAATELAAAEAALAAQESQSSTDMTRLQTSRDKIATQIAPGALAIFTRVAERHEGEALVPVVKLYPKKEEYACSGCNMKLTLDIVNSLRTRDDIQICQVCGRILHFDAALLSPAR